jgi:hypothetical protein
MGMAMPKYTPPPAAAPTLHYGFGSAEGCGRSKDGRMGESLTKLPALPDGL